MIDLKSPVAVLPKVGPKYKELLKKLEIASVADLLYHFPFRYNDFSKVKNIAELTAGEEVTVLGELRTVANIFTKNGKRLTKADFTDVTGKTSAIWFNQHYLKTVLKPGSLYYFSGKVDLFAGKINFISPDFEEKSENNLNTARLVPVYPETAGVSSKWLRARINDILSKKENLEDLLPKNILEKENLNNVNWCLSQIHFPDSNMEASLARDRFAFEELFLEMLKVTRRKKEWDQTLRGIKMAPKKGETQEFVQKLPFELTDSQKEAVKEILEDLQKSHPMNRLLEGDVGTGKTIVALIAALFAHLNGYKTLYMAPTEILANQHFETFNKFLGNLAKIELCTGNKKPKGEWDILIGTHALLFNNEYTDIGLVIIDEQHRFGVEQRGKIVEMGKSGKTPHLLTMTATPIPRTLALTVYGDLQISALKTHPNALRKITTKVVSPKNREETYKWIAQKNEPTFIVCPLIDESESVSLENVKAAQKEFETLKTTVFKDVSVGLLHGRMKPKEKEEIVQKFRSGEIRVLVSTPVIEVGIDVPDATIMVIESAQRYGLASLHQLRGRVGRGSKEGFCFVCMEYSGTESFERLKNLEKINNGLELAEIDLKMRGAGDVFGTIQHGFKKFKVASIYDVEMMNKAKFWSNEIFEQIDKYPLLKNTLDLVDQSNIKNN